EARCRGGGGGGGGGAPRPRREAVAAMNLTEFLDASATRHAARAAVTDVRSGRVLTYRELAGEAGRVAAFLGSCEVEPRQRIGLICPHGLAYHPAALRLLATGAALVALPAALT